MMPQENLLLAIKQSSISKIAVIDDAFDLPPITDDNAGPLLEAMDDVDAFRALAAEVDIIGDIVDKAIEAAINSQYGEQPLLELLSALYGKYGETFEEKYNPGGIFGDQTINLRHLAPVMKLLNTCDPRPSVVRFGSSSADLSDAKDVELIFIDAFLDPKVSADSAPRAKNAAMKNSLDKVTSLVRSLGDKAPSVILMSSSGAVRKDAEKYRKDIQSAEKKGLVYASRFGFLEKTRLTILAEGRLGVEEDAADDLLDIFQSYQFGRSMHTAMETWLASAERATAAMRGDLERLHLKDFAYLVRFRLQEEGQSLVEYLDWFFGECLLDALGKKIDEASSSEDLVTFLNEKGAEQIEGAYEGRTATVADLYHRVRIESPRKIRKGGELRLGDLFLSGKKAIFAIMTPDCDLVARGKKKIPSASKILLIGGEIKDFDAPETTIADFIMIDGKPRNIKWDLKKIETHDFGGFPDKQGLKYAGTLRPMYAQELQRRVLHDLGRVGVATAPAIGINAAVTVHVQRKAGDKAKIELGDPKVADCTIMLSRGGTSKASALFGRGFVPELLQALTSLDISELVPHAEGQIAALKQDGASKKFEKMYRNGIACEDTIDLGICLTASKNLKSKNDQTWCWILIEMGEQLLAETLDAAATSG